MSDTEVGAEQRALWNWDSSYPAPAKLNLFLHVVGRRPDGYHALQTVFRFVDYADQLQFSARDADGIVLINPLPGVPPDSDLTLRAARLLRDECGCRQGVDIRLSKRLPLGGGLGGGSSDAASVLLALNHLWRLGLPRRRLQEIGLALGADVPVFVFGQNAFAEGVGEALQPLELPEDHYVVLEPPVQVATAAVFAAPELKRDSPPMAAADWAPGVGRNDLVPIVTARFPVVAEYLDWLARFGEARLTGSGACVFAAFSRRQAALEVLARKPAGMRGWYAAGLAEHPLRALAQ
ncbi:MAG: 4-(cytidine 5'-diphospho)-2-C-methyl-D-erythritol kinase [Propionivibrio sp.]